MATYDSVKRIWWSLAACLHKGRGTGRTPRSADRVWVSAILTEEGIAVTGYGLPASLPACLGREQLSQLSWGPERKYLEICCKFSWGKARETAAGSGSGLAKTIWSKQTEEACLVRFPSSSVPLNGWSKPRSRRIWREKGERRPFDSGFLI